MMNRHPQWEERLHAFLIRRHSKPHAWGRHDCVMLVADAAKAVTGKDHARGHRGKYDSHAKAYRYLRQAFGVDSPEALLDKLFPAKRVGFAGRGDLVLCSFHIGELADGTPASMAFPGICMGGFALVAGEDGLERVPRGPRWLKAWAVGDHHSGEAAHG